MRLFFKYLIYRTDLCGPLSSYAVRVDYIKNLTGIDFVPFLEDNSENYLENSVRKKDGWNFSRVY